MISYNYAFFNYTFFNYTFNYILVMYITNTYLNITNTFVYIRMLKESFLLRKINLN